MDITEFMLELADSLSDMSNVKDVVGYDAYASLTVVLDDSTRFTIKVDQIS